MQKKCVEDNISNTNPHKQQENVTVPNPIHAHCQLYYEARNKGHLIRSDKKLAKTNLEMIKGTVTLSPRALRINLALSVY